MWCEKIGLVRPQTVEILSFWCTIRVFRIRFTRESFIYFSIALLKNADLVISGPRKGPRMAIFNALFLYVIFPWAAILFTLNSLIAYSFNPEFGYSWESFSVAAIILTLITRQGRFVAKGIFISILAHIQAVTGRRYQSWEPVRWLIPQWQTLPGS